MDRRDKRATDGRKTDGEEFLRSDTQDEAAEATRRKTREECREAECSRRRKKNVTEAEK